jgi:uncharacterized membrane protein
MNAALKVMGLLPWTDWAALLGFFGAWVGYALFASRRSEEEPTLLAATNRVRRQWMLQTTYRDVRVIDGVIVQNLSTSPSFFASTTILIIGGLLAVLGTSEKATELVREIPFVERTSLLIFDLKLMLLLMVFIYAFFRFTWSLRQYGFGALLVASAPTPEHFAADDEARKRFADRAGRVMGLAAEAFNAGLRAYYMAFAAIGWFFSPLVFALSTTAVVCVLYQREFRSDLLAVLRDDAIS